MKTLAKPFGKTVRKKQQQPAKLKASKPKQQTKKKRSTSEPNENKAAEASDKSAPPSKQPKHPQQKTKRQPAKAKPAPTSKTAPTAQPPKPKKKTPTKRRYPDTWILPVPHDTGPVQCAAYFVASELRQGLWPSSYVRTGVPPVEHAVQHTQHMQHMHNAAAGIEHFAQHVVYPAMHNAGACPAEWSIENPPRAFFATLLALRELMAQNVTKIFGNDFYRRAESSSVEGRRQSPSTPTARSSRHLLAMSFATSIILSAIESCVPNRHEQAIQRFLSHVKDYDLGHDQFAKALHKRDGSVCGILPNGKRLNPEENVAMTIAYNRAVDQHNLIRRQQERMLKLPGTLVVGLPRPNACHMVLLEQKQKIAFAPTAVPAAISQSTSTAVGASANAGTDTKSTKT